MIWVTCWPSTSMGLASSSLSCCSLSSRLASLTLFEEIWEFATEMGAWVYPRSLSKIVLYANNASNPATIHSSGFLSTLFRFIRLGPGGLDPPWLGGSCDTRHHDLDNRWCLDTCSSGYRPLVRSSPVSLSQVNGRYRPGVPGRCPRRQRYRVPSDTLLTISPSRVRSVAGSAGATVTHS